MSGGYQYISCTVIAVADIRRIGAGVGCAAVARVNRISGSIGTSRAVFTVSVLTDRDRNIRAAVIAVARITRIGARVGCTAITCICGIGRLIGTSRAVFSASVLARGY